MNALDWISAQIEISTLLTLKTIAAIGIIGGSYHELMARRGVTPDLAKAVMRTNTTAIGAVMVHRGEADSLICGTFGEYRWHLKYVDQILGNETLQPNGALSLMILEDGLLFIADTHVWVVPTPEQIAKTVIGAARHVRRFGLRPKIALCAQSQFGNIDSDSGPAYACRIGTFRQLRF